ncbi:MAG: hypothetical protein AB7N73_13965, partial [Gemmatimonadales bacterium]
LTRQNLPSSLGLYARVVMGSGACSSNPNPYALGVVGAYSLQLSATVLGAETDPSEPNDNQGAATTLSSGQARTGVITHGDEDWYRLNLSGSVDVTLTLSVPSRPTVGYLHVTLLDGTGAVLGSTCIFNSSALSVPLTRQNLPSSLGLYARVVMGSGACSSNPNPYALGVVGAYSLQLN